MEEQKRSRPSEADRATDDPWGILSRDDDQSFFCMRMLGERYAFDASHALEVIRLGLLTRLPASPSFLPGVFNHRGEVLAVLDLGQLISDKPTSFAHGSRSVIVQAGPWKLALLAEGIEGLIRIRSEDLEPPPSAGSSTAELLSQVGHDDRGAVAILDLRRVVDAARARSLA
ncbi:chemotaxis protein CheW [Vulgatibacter incomptus]|uniref:Positive regulator of CheA protein activity (CheW) n=1 Tax=Vulgatibacter incomptus TaxID=1391653 RepID=A0A0K1PH09_9BACT|nr:chemotaxis protein CheW [Vulgatibacter incomptus]AKU92404.1 Positive regulator of CheA protein activity (CheW) [Vulgatibacter incomptus]